MGASGSKVYVDVTPIRRSFLAGLEPPTYPGVRTLGVTHPRGSGLAIEHDSQSVDVPGPCRRALLQDPLRSGGLERPITDAGLDDKLRGLAEGVLPAARVDRLLERLWSLDKIDDAADLAREVQGS